MLSIVIIHHIHCSLPRVGEDSSDFGESYSDFDEGYSDFGERYSDFGENYSDFGEGYSVVGEGYSDFGVRLSCHQNQLRDQLVDAVRVCVIDRVSIQPQAPRSRCRY